MSVSFRELEYDSRDETNDEESADETVFDYDSDSSSSSSRLVTTFSAII